MSARIEIRGLRVMAVHGVLAAERLRAQPFELDINVGIKTDRADRAALSDDLADTVDYGKLVHIATDVMARAPHSLLETLAAAVAEALLEVEGTIEATVTVRKLRPPVEADVDSVGVRVTRSRNRPE